MVLEFIKAFIYGVVEGITEWLPISSTGHLILLDELISLDVGAELGESFHSEFSKMFDVVIQLGAILAVAVIFWERISPFCRTPRQKQTKDVFSLYKKIAVACIPAIIAGILIESVLKKISGMSIDEWLYNPTTVAIMLILYGILFIVVEKRGRDKPSLIADSGMISYKQAFFIGCSQALAIVPGTSRSGSTILGGMLLGCSRGAASEFSFLLALPTMLGASVLKAVVFLSYTAKADLNVPIYAWIALATGFVSAFAVSIITVRFLMELVKKHTFTGFGIYRIILGIAVIIFFALKTAKNI